MTLFWVGPLEQNEAHDAQIIEPLVQLLRMAETQSIQKDAAEQLGALVALSHLNNQDAAIGKVPSLP